MARLVLATSRPGWACSGGHLLDLDPAASAILFEFLDGWGCFGLGLALTGMCCWSGRRMNPEPAGRRIDAKS